MPRYDQDGEYKDFWDWLLYSWHALWIVSLVFAYLVYLLTTTEE